MQEPGPGFLTQTLFHAPLICLVLLRREFYVCFSGRTGDRHCAMTLTSQQLIRIWFLILFKEFTEPGRKERNYFAGQFHSLERHSALMIT